MNATESLVHTLDLVAANLERTQRLFVAMDAELKELRRGLDAAVEQMVTENDLIGATQDLATRQDLADLEATVRDLVATPFE